MPVYSKTAWVDGTTPAISAANLNKLEQGVFDSLRQDGSTTMSAQLVTIAGTVGTPAIAPTGDSNTGIFFPAADTIAFGEGGTEVMRINSSGNVGIGTVSPTSELHVYSAASTADIMVETNTTGGDAKIALKTNGTGGRHWYLQTGDNGSGLNGRLRLFDQTAGAERITILDSGNVGIGTTSPSSKFEVYGAITRTVTVDGSNASPANETGLIYRHPVTASNRAGINFLNTYANNGAAWMSFLTTNTSNTYAERARIDATGYLLIGYTASNGAYPLQVNGQIFATSSTIATSDGRYKKDVVSLDGALDIVAALNPVQFNWKEHPVHKFNTEVPTIGFIAQEVAEVLKDKAYLTSVIKKSECTWETEIDEVIETHKEEFYGIAESNMIAILTKAIQELNAKVEALEAQLAK